MKHTIIFLFLIFVFCACETEDDPIYDQTASVYGLVKSGQGALLDNVQLGFVTGPDSLNDLNFEIFTLSDSGRYRIDWFLGPTPLPYKRMCAYKPGYIIWRFEENKTDVVTVNKYTDSLNIIMYKE